MVNARQNAWQVKMEAIPPEHRKRFVSVRQIEQSDAILSHWQRAIGLGGRSE
jgi:hypothetical protein